MSKKYLVIFLGCFLFIYGFLWSYILKDSSKPKLKKNLFQKVYFSSNTSQNNINWPSIDTGFVLSASDVSTPVPKKELPLNYKINIQPRRQAFNLSCEFAAASSIIYHFTNNLDFSMKNELSAEKLLMAKMEISQNPNIGIRMGETASKSAEILYRNLNQRFGGTDYYGVHAPPFIELFGNYKLAAKPLNKNSDLVFLIKEAVSSNHLVMAWIQIGYGKPIDVALSYGTVPIIKGEHAVVVNGYNQQGFYIMDPGIGFERFVSFNDFLNATKQFSMPFLEVFPSDTAFSFVPSFPIDKPTGLNRNIINIKIENGSKRIGAGSEVAGILRDFGYHIIEIETITCEDCEGLKLKIKENFKDYIGLLKKDMALAFYENQISTGLSASESADIIITIGE